MKQENPIPIRRVCPNFPSAKFDAIPGNCCEIFFGCPAAPEHRFHLIYSHAIQIGRMQDPGTEQPPCDCGARGQNHEHRRHKGNEAILENAAHHDSGFPFVKELTSS
jgi:hypothetical protein